MKQPLYKGAGPVLILLSIALAAHPQSKDAAENKRIVESKNYIFRAQTASPQRGRNVNLTSEYDLTVTGDSIISYLPYYGHAYTAPLNPSQAGIMFTSVKFDYSVVAKKGKWQISIKPKDVSEVQQLYLDIFDNGTADLRVMLQNRQPISFNGYVIEGKEQGKKAF